MCPKCDEANKIRSDIRSVSTLIWFLKLFHCISYSGLLFKYYCFDATVSVHSVLSLLLKQIDSYSERGETDLSHLLIRAY